MSRSLAWEKDPNRWQGIPIVEFHNNNSKTFHNNSVGQKHYSNLSSIDWAHEYERERHFKKFTNSQTPWHRTLRNSYRWVVLIGTGALIGILTACLDYLYKWLTDLKGGYCNEGAYMTYTNCCKGIREGDVCDNWKQWDQVIHIDKNTAGSFIYKYFLYLTTSLILAISTAFVVKDSSFIKTSGISEAKTIISGLIIKDFLSFKTLLVKFIGLTLIVSSGMWVGKEGPLVHISCCCANILIKAFPSLDHNEAIRRELLLAATAAGISVAFNAPIGGVLFTFEQMSSYFNASDKMWSSFVCAMAGVVILNTFKEGVDILVTMENQWLSIEMFGFVLLGVLGGIYGAAFNRLNMWFANLRQKYISSKGINYEILEIIGLSLVTSVLTYPLIFPRLPLTTLITRLYKDCEEGDSNIVGGLCGNSEGFTLLVFTGIIAVFLTSYTFGTFIPAGVLMPSLAIGAIVGRLLGIVFEKIQNANPVLSSLCERSSRLCISPGAYAVVGSAAFLTGVTKMTVWVVVTVFELTGALTYVLPIMITVLVARWTNDKFDEKSCYDLWIKFFGYPYLTEVQKPLPLIKSETFMSPYEKVEAIFLEDQITIATLESVLEYSYQGLPVLTSRDEPKLIGWLPICDLRYEFEKIRGITGISSDQKVSLVKEDDGNDNKYPMHHLLETNYINLSPDLPLPTLVEYFFKLKPRYVLFCKNGVFKGLVTLKDISEIAERSTDELLRMSENNVDNLLEDIEEDYNAGDVIFRNEMTNTA